MTGSNGGIGVSGCGCVSPFAGDHNGQDALALELQRAEGAGWLQLIG